MTDPRQMVGFHLPADDGGWGRDVVGYLLGEFADGWYVVGNHVSSNGSWSREDIRYHAEKFEGVPYEWLGEKRMRDIAAAYPKGTAEAAAEESGVS